MYRKALSTTEYEALQMPNRPLRGDCARLRHEYERILTRITWLSDVAGTWLLRDAVAGKVSDKLLRLRAV
jgi:hypothetical protein